MSTKKSIKSKKQLNSYVLRNRNVNGFETNGIYPNEEHMVRDQTQDENKTVLSNKTTSTSASRRRRMQIDLEKLEEMSKLEREAEEKEMERAKQEMQMELERAKQEMQMELERAKQEMEMQQMELERRKQEMERQRKLEKRELERQKRLLEARAELRSASVKSSCYSNSEVGFRVKEDFEEESQGKVEKWLNDKEPLSNVGQMSSSAIVTSAVEKLADSFRLALQPNSDNSLRQHLPSFSGKPDEWPIFYSAYEKSMKFFSEEDNLIRLRKCLEGDAYKMVKPLFVSGKNLKAVIKTLQMRFGRPEFILDSMQNKTKMLPPVTQDDINGLIEFSTNVLNFTTTAESLKMENYMANPQLLMELLEKLPYSLKYNWAQHVNFMSLAKPSLKDLSSWLEKQCEIMSIYFRPQQDTVLRRKHDTKPVFASSTTEKYFVCAFCNEKHESAQCKNFRKADVSQRWKMVAEKKLCFYCFRQHQIKFCKVKKACGINNCRLFHHRLLHTDKQEKTSDSRKEPAQPDTKPKEINNKHTDDVVTKSVLLRVCPVTLFGPNNSEIDTYALLDDGSTISLLDSATADKLGVKGTVEPLTTCWSNSTCHFESQSQKVSLKIKGLYEEEVFTLENVRTQSPLDLPMQNIDTVKLRDKWPHLNTVNQPIPTVNSKPTILIGQDNINLILTRKIIEGPVNSPVLTWSYLGWTMHGRCAKFNGRIDKDFTLTTFEYDKLQHLHDMVKETFKSDSYGDTPSLDAKHVSPEDERAIAILEQTTTKIENHYETGLLWKSDEFSFPPSYDNALKRYKTIEKKMDKDPDFCEKYTEKIYDYIKKGYVKKLSKEEVKAVNDRTYYLPHFGVVNPNKPGKLRLVFDAAAKSNGVSFNDALLSGPDYLNSLPSVLLKFRLGKFAIVGDIQEMFHQVKIREEDVNSQRFLWRNEDVKQTPDVYVMKAMTFGSTCSPSSALFVVNHNARQFTSLYPEASKSILTKEYMDDLLDSTDSVEEARRRIHEITKIHESGGFKMCNWLSNSKEVLEDVPHDLKSNSTKQLLKTNTHLSTERVLGMSWNPDTDNFDFHHSAEKIESLEVLYPTKREILRAAMSIFDPLGLVSPTTIKGRLLVQDVWRLKIQWDEVLPSEICEKWRNWLEEVKTLHIFTIPRCYFSSSTLKNISLHVFVDASQEAFAAVVYLVQQKDDSYKSMLVASRAKVAPLKPTTTPRLELQAAVLGCRLAQSVQKDLDIPVVRRTFWSDSVTVLHWVKSESKVYKQFVSNRIGEIQQLSTPGEWIWVPSKQNPADMSTRSNERFNFITHHKWIHGPDFLCQSPNNWPKQPSTLEVKDTKETKKHFVGVHENNLPQVVDFNKFSSWEKLTRTLAWVLRFVEVLKQQVKTNNQKRLPLKSETDYNKISELKPEEVKTAEKLLLSVAQDESFKEEKYLLAHKKPLPKSSRIYNLSPFLDSTTNLIRMTARTSNAPDLEPEQKVPIILDGKSHVAKLIVRAFHEMCFHQGIETVICKARERFWILNIRTLVKSVKNKCMKCRISNTKPRPPQMAPLPEMRVTRADHPFHFTGVDYFGPIEVTVGRRHEKRYGVIFTCLSVRAVHLEVAHSLTTESCIMAIQRFISRRPCPLEMYSDNGTNFVSADKELQTAVKTLDHVQIQRTAARSGINWNFIPPRAPHMGGCWERLVRSVKTALRSVMHSQFPRDEEFQTFLARVEFIINSRPLTHVSMDPKDMEPLTPNHFLREAFKFPIDEDLLCQKQLARVKSFLDCFWKRWIHEYLPCLTRRCKWHTKTDPPKPGDIAFIVEENNPRNTWPLGRISAVYPGRDGQVRVVDVTTTYGTFRRPMTKVAVIGEGEKM